MFGRHSELYVVGFVLVVQRGNLHFRSRFVSLRCVRCRQIRNVAWLDWLHSVRGGNVYESRDFRDFLLGVRKWQVQCRRFVGLHGLLCWILHGRHGRVRCMRCGENRSDDGFSCVCKLLRGDHLVGGIFILLRLLCGVLQRSRRHE